MVYIWAFPSSSICTLVCRAVKNVQCIYSLEFYLLPVRFIVHLWKHQSPFYRFSAEYFDIPYIPDYNTVVNIYNQVCHIVIEHFVNKQNNFSHGQSSFYSFTYPLIYQHFLTTIIDDLFSSFRKPVHIHLLDALSGIFSSFLLGNVFYVLV